MNKIAGFLTTAGLVMLMTCPLLRTAFAQETQGVTGSDEATIRSLEEQGRIGVLNRDEKALKLVWSEHFMVNTPANRVSPNRDVVFDLMRQGLIHYSSFERKIEHLRVDGDIAIVMGAETVIPKGKAPFAGQTVQRRFTNIWHKDGGQWRLIARHANIVPSN